jgi:hypothetical protein
MSRLPRIVALLVIVVLLAATPRLLAVVIDPQVNRPIDVINRNVLNPVLENSAGVPPRQDERPTDVLAANLYVLEPSDAVFEGEELEFRVGLAPADAARETAIVFNWVIPPNEADGAQEGRDYEESSGRGTIGPGEAVGTFSIPTLVNDLNSEPRSLIVYVSLDGENPIFLTGTIFDRPAIAVEAAASVSEGQSLVFDVELDRSVGLPVSYRWQVTDGAEWLAEGQPTSGESTIGPGRTGDPILLATRDDELENGPRSVTVRVSADGVARVEASGEIRDVIAAGGGEGGGGETGWRPGPIHYIAAVLVAIMVSFAGLKILRWARAGPHPPPADPGMPKPETPPASPPIAPTAAARAGPARLAPIGLSPAVPPIELAAVAGMARVGPMTAMLVEEGVDDG